MKLIPLTQGKFAMVDDKDFEWLNQWKWYAHRQNTFFYVRRGINSRIKILMHRIILNIQDGLFVDHIDRNTLNNQRSNLRACTNSENQMNTIKPKNNTSGYKGVIFYKHGRLWAAQIKVNKKQIYIGCFKNKLEAAKAYNIAALKYHGEFAYLNSFPLEHK